MAIVFKDAKIFASGYEVQSQFNKVALDSAVEALGETTFGMSTRSMRGGLKTVRLTGGGFYQACTGNVDPVFHESVALQDIVVALFPEEITEGATSTGSGYMFKAEILKWTPIENGQVGALQMFNLEAAGRGVGA